MSQFDELPEGWEEVRIEEIAQKVGSGATPRGGSKAYKQSGIPLIRSMNVHFDGLHEEGIVYLDEHQADGLKNVEVKAKDVLLNITGASIGRVTQAPEKMEGARVNQHVCIIRPTENFDPAFLTKYLTSPKVQRVITAEEYGMTRQALTKQMILDFEIPLPPLNEQQRIVEKIEALTARSRRAREALEAIPELLDQFRQSVLAAAFRGDLTADWREQNPDVEPAEALLERIRVEKEFADSNLFRKPPKRPKDVEVPNWYIPESWEKVLTHDLFAFVTSGSRGWAKYYSDKGATFLRVGNLDRNTIQLDLSDIQKVNPPDGAEGIRTKIEIGDILVSITADIGMIGLAGDLGEAYINQHVALARPIKGFSREYLAWYLASYADGYQQFQKLQRGATKTGLGLEDIRNIWIPLPPLAEQQAVVEAINSHLDAIYEIEKQYTSAQFQFEELDQSILAKAFRGDLVPQDPNDEPAAVLLERIRAEQSNSKGKRQKAKGKKEEG